jgi:murein DD-endopeptidase MepM/ murein hydrolase activator NlpD/HAMP domain-containing protein
MLNFGTAVEATNTSLNSYGSAAREQAEYNKSLEARINRLTTAWYEFANVLGGTIVYDTIVVATEALQALTDVGEQFGSSNLGIASAVGLAGTAIASLFSGVRNYTGSLIQSTAQNILNGNSTRAGTAAIIQNTGALISNQVQMARASIASRGLAGSLVAVAGSATAAGTAIRTALSLTGIGLAITAVSLGLSVLINRLSEAAQAQEEYDTMVETNIKALSENGEEVDRLISTYESLNNVRQRTAEQEQEYLGIQNQLASLFPSIVDYVDSTGQAHIKTGDALEREIAFTRELIDLQQEAITNDALSTFDTNTSNIEDARKDIKAYEKLIEDTRKNLARAESGNPLYAFSDTGQYEREIRQYEAGIIKLQKQIADFSQESVSAILDISNALDDTPIDGNLSKEIERLLRTVDLSETTPEKLNEIAEAVAKIKIELDEALKAGDQETFVKLNGELATLLNTASASSVNTATLAINFTKLSEAAKEVADNFESADDSLNGLDSGVTALDEKISDLYEGINDYKDITEELAGVTQFQVDSSADLLYQYEALSRRLDGVSEQQLKDLLQKQNLTDEERNLVKSLQQRGDVIAQLAVIYPQLASLEENAIALNETQLAQIREEQRAYEVLLKAYELDRDGKLSAEQSKTLAVATGTANRIKDTRAEIEQLNQLIKQYENTANAALTSQQFIDRVNSGELQAHSGSFVLPNAAQQVREQVTALELDLSNYTSTLSGYANSLGKAIAEEEKSSKKSNSSKSSSIYITDKYKQSLEALNLQIEKQNALQNDYPKHSNQYRKALEGELKLQQQKLKLLKDQEKALQQQIESGRIAQTGNISTTSTSTSTTNRSGNAVSLLDSIQGGRISDTYGTVRSIRNGRIHTGIDIAAQKGTNLPSNVSGKVTSTGYNSLSGNFVSLLDDNGFRHFYGHLDSISVKIGEIVEQGQRLGAIGNTGNSTGPHLHYQVTNPNGQTINPQQFATTAQNGITTSVATTNAAISKTQESIDQAKSTVNSLGSEILAQQQKIAELERAIIESNLATYEFRSNTLQNIYAHDVAALRNLTRGTAAYNNNLKRQVDSLERKQVVNIEELAYINDLISKGGLSATVLDTLQTRAVEVKTAIQEANYELQQLDFTLFNDKLDFKLKDNDQNITALNIRLQELNTNSEAYNNTLDQIARNLNTQQIETREAANELNRLISSGKFTGDTLEQAKDRVQELTNSLRELTQEASKARFDLIVNIQTNADEAIDDLAYQLQLSEIFQGRYTEGTLNYNLEAEKQISILEQQAKLYDESRRKIKEQITQYRILGNDVKALTEILEDQSLAYNQIQANIANTRKELEEFDKQARNDIADAYINAYKEYIGARRDDHIKALDEERKREQDRHDQLVRQYNNELDLFRRNVEERLRLIDRQESERSYNQEINDLEAERRKIVDRYNRLLLDDSYEANKERTRIEEERDKLDRQIAERKHDRDIELQKQGLNDLLETKEEELKNAEEVANEELQTLIAQLDKQKEYWEKYYEDLLNDERRFAQIRADIVAGNFDKINAEFQGFISELEATLPNLENTLDGTMKAVGTSIRQNIIDNLNNALKLLDDYQAKQNASSSYNETTYSDDFDPNSPKQNIGDGNYDTGIVTPANNYTTADYKVLFGKYLRENLVPIANNESAKASLRQKGNQVAAEGRKEGSIISPDETLSSALSKFSSEQRSGLKSYVRNNASSYLQTPALLNNVLNWAARLNTGGYINSTGAGIDGIGGKVGILHPSEVVLDKVDTARLFDNIEQSDSLVRSLDAVLSPFTGYLRNSTNVLGNVQPQGTGNVEILFTGNVYTENQNTLENFANALGNESRLRFGGY